LTVRIGLIGYGFGGRRFHAPFIASATGCALAGVVTRSPERRAELERDHPGVPAYDSLADVAAAGVDAVVITTPASTHTALTLEAIQLGLPVVCDKPFALDAAAAREAVQAAERTGVVLSVYQNRRWDSDFLTVRRLLEAGALGTVSRFESRFEVFQPVEGAPPAGGGTLRDFGSHLFDQALLLFGPVQSVYAELSVREDRGGLDDGFFAALRHSCGVVSHLTGSWAHGAPGPRFRVSGSTGAYVVARGDSQGDAVVAGRTPAGDAWGVEPQERWGELRRGDAGEPVPSERGRWDAYYPAFAAAVRGESQVPVDPRDAVAALEVLDAARLGASRGAVVEVMS
jgi:predicted dehydrogenase